jgi:5-formyltetrahydrofolate cyclo-ligase
MSRKNHDIRLTKQKIRNTILMILKKQKEEERNRKSSIIKKKLCRTRIFKKAKIIMFYKSFAGEVNTEDMIKLARKSGKIVVVPVCSRDRMMAPCVLDDNAGFLRGPYGVWEPAVKKPVDLKKIDLVIAPGLGFTKSGKRLGRGKGYYDRFLERFPDRAVSIGLAFDFQIFPDIPTNKNDINVHRVIFA